MVKLTRGRETYVCRALLWSLLLLHIASYYFWRINYNITLELYKITYSSQNNMCAAPSANSETKVLYFLENIFFLLVVAVLCPFSIIKIRKRVWITRDNQIILNLQKFNIFSFNIPNSVEMSCWCDNIYIQLIVHDLQTIIKNEKDLLQILLQSLFEYLENK